MTRTVYAGIFALAVSPLTHGQDATYTARHMTLETATQAARAALESCRKAGYQVAVAVVSFPPSVPGYDSTVRKL